MKTLILELKKQKRTGILAIFMGLGFLGAIYEWINFAIRHDSLLGLPMPPMDILLTQLYGMIMVLNLFGIVLACCLIYHMEFEGDAFKKLIVLPISLTQIYLVKLLILTIAWAICLLIQNLSLALIGEYYLPEGTFILPQLIRYAGYTFLTGLPVMAFMQLIASRIKSLWLTLGIGVGGFLSGMALAPVHTDIFLIDPFVIMLRPAVVLQAEPEAVVSGISIVITVILTILGLINANCMWKRGE